MKKNALFEALLMPSSEFFSFIFQNVPFFKVAFKFKQTTISLSSVSTEIITLIVPYSLHQSVFKFTSIEIYINCK